MSSNSKTTWHGSDGQERLDVENPAPGKRPGQIHYHEKNNTKHMFNFANNKFENATSAMDKLFSDSDFVKGLKRAFEILGDKWG